MQNRENTVPVQAAKGTLAQKNQNVQLDGQYKNQMPTGLTVNLREGQQFENVKTKNGTQC